MEKVPLRLSTGAGPVVAAGEQWPYASGQQAVLAAAVAASEVIAVGLKPLTISQPPSENSNPVGTVVVR